MPTPRRIYHAYPFKQKSWRLKRQINALGRFCGRDASARLFIAVVYTCSTKARKANGWQTIFARYPSSISPRPAIRFSNAPAVLRDRLAAAASSSCMIGTFMSCGARLPVYALFAAAFFAENGQNVVFALYLLGIALALVTGLILKGQPVAPAAVGLFTGIFAKEAVTPRSAISLRISAHRPTRCARSWGCGWTRAA